MEEMKAARVLQDVGLTQRSLSTENAVISLTGCRHTEQQHDGIRIFKYITRNCGYGICSTVSQSKDELVKVKTNKTVIAGWYHASYINHARNRRNVERVLQFATQYAKSGFQHKEKTPVQAPMLCIIRMDGVCKVKKESQPVWWLPI